MKKIILALLITAMMLTQGCGIFDSDDDGDESEEDIFEACLTGVCDPVNGEACDETLDRCNQNLCQRCAADIGRLNESWPGRLNNCVSSNSCGCEIEGIAGGAENDCVEDPTTSTQGLYCSAGIFSKKCSICSCLDGYICQNEECVNDPNYVAPVEDSIVETPKDIISVPEVNQTSESENITYTPEVEINETLNSTDINQSINNTNDTES